MTRVWPHGQIFTRKAFEEKAKYLEEHPSEARLELYCMGPSRERLALELFMRVAWLDEVMIAVDPWRPGINDRCAP